MKLMYFLTNIILDKHIDHQFDIEQIMSKNYYSICGIVVTKY